MTRMSRMSRIARTQPLLLGCALLLTACGAESPPPEAVEPAEPAAATEPEQSPAFLALHVYNPTSDEAHEQFLARLGELNRAVASSGHPETQYRAWKVMGEQAGDYGYLFGSLWADRATYEAVHEHDDYKAVMARFEQEGFEPFEGEVYNQYVALNRSATEPPPMPEGGPKLLALHRFNLPSTAAEQQLAGILNDFTEAVGHAGHPETAYALWKVTGEQAGEFAYVFGSLWADQAAYDAAHEHADFQAVMETHEAAYQGLITEEVYNRYERLTLP